MEQKRQFPRWIVITAVIVLICAGVKVWYDRLCYGEIDISDIAPSKEMLLHILEHVDELAARPDLFEVEIRDDDTTLVYYIGNPSYEYANILYFPDAADALADPASSLRVSAHYYRNNYSDFWDIVLPWSTLNLNFSIEEELSYAWLIIQDAGAPAISDAPLREMMSAIESVIGTP